MTELFYLSITICYANYSILLFQKQGFSPRFSAIHLTFLSCGTYYSVIISPIVVFVCVRESVVYPFTGWLMLAYLGAVPTALAYGLFMRGRSVCVTRPGRIRWRGGTGTRPPPIHVIHPLSLQDGGVASGPLIPRFGWQRSSGFPGACAALVSFVKSLVS
jgi:hypothetical protein